MLEDYELAGIPNLSGEPEYSLNIADVIYSMNAASRKKEAVWTFFEYMLSTDFQKSILEEYTCPFPARRDVFDKALQDEIAIGDDNEEYDVIRYHSLYVDEQMRNERGDISEEDRKNLLYILDHVAGCEAMTGDFNNIFHEEMKAFWSNLQSAEITAHNIQNRMTLLLTE